MNLVTRNRLNRSAPLWAGLILVSVGVFLLVWWLRTGGNMDAISPRDAFEEMRAGHALLVDVREEDELRETGWAEGAFWLPMSRMDEGDELWKRFQELARKKHHIIFYCRSGNRSGRVATFLEGEGFRTSNMGGFKDWVAAGLPLQTGLP